MSGVGEASAIIGIISGVIAVADAAKNMYDAADDAEGLPTAFREVAARLPLIQKTLEVIKALLQVDSIDEGTRAIIESSVERARNKAEQLLSIFEKCIPGENASRQNRYVAAIRTLGKGHKVEILMKDLLGTMQDMTNSQAIKSATRSQVSELMDAFKAVSDVEPSVSDELIDDPPSSRNVHAGTGDMYVADGDSRQFNAKGNARQYHATTMTFGS